MDLGYVGYKFMWCNKSYDGNLIKERLDRGLVPIKWRYNYPQAKVLHLEMNGSDHYPLLLQSSPPNQVKKRRFKFQECWCNLEEVRNIVKQVWSMDDVGSHMFKLFQKLKHVDMSW